MEPCAGVPLGDLGAAVRLEPGIARSLQYFPAEPCVLPVCVAGEALLEAARNGGFAVRPVQ